MSTMDAGDLDLEAAMPILAKHKEPLAAVRRRYGKREWPNAARMMVAGRFEGDIGDDLHDFLHDLVMNGGVCIWQGLIDLGGDKYPVDVNDYCGLFWVKPLEEDAVGFFASRDAAIQHAMGYESIEETPRNRASRVWACAV